MKTLILVHLTSLSPDKQAASVEFNPHLTVIYGASESGKSYIAEAIDFMLGATSLKSIREAEGYTHILLGLRVSDGTPITLCRELGGTNVQVFDGDVRQLPTTVPGKTLALKHNPKSENNLSRYLLKIIEVDGKRVLKNARREVRTLSFRDLAHVCIISDSRMADKHSPVLASAQKILETEDKSVFRFLLTGQDEPEGPVGATGVEKKVGKGKVDLLDQLIVDTQTRLESTSSEDDLKAQLFRLEAALADASLEAGGLVDQRSALVEHGRSLQWRASELHERSAEVRSLLGRFGLLRQQYESDIDRLKMVGEAGSLLGYFFREGPCVFCGAAPEHQHPGHQMAETDELQIAVAAETRKTSELHNDLLTTIQDLEAQLDYLEGEQDSLATEVHAVRRKVSTLDTSLAPLQQNAGGLIEKRAKVQSDLALHAQIQRLEDLKATLSNGPSVVPALPGGLPAVSIAEFEQTMQSILTSWQVPGENHVVYNQKTAEIFVDDRPRGSRGRGMRSVIHAAFTVALARYTAARGFAHPGFVVLDSPLITYREPDEDFQMPWNVVEHFYRALLDDASAQVIVVENVDPPVDLGERATVYPFHTAGASRLGFYPA